MGDTAHPFIPNTAPEARARALKTIGIDSVEEIYASVPDRVRFKGTMDLPAPIRSEGSLRRHLERIVSKNLSTRDNLSFLGGGCWPHYVPAVCDEIANRGEFVTAYGGGELGDHGKWQAVFEFQSLLGELIGMDVVSAPTYDWGAAANSALLMATRYTGRSELLVPESISADRYSQMYNFVRPVASISKVRMDPATGLMDLDDLRAKVSDRTAAVYFENPSFLGTVEIGARDIVETAKKAGALAIAGVDPITLGVIAPPGDYGADIVVGDIQPLGIHMNGGGGLAGFIASRDEPKIVAEYNALLLSVAPGIGEGEVGFKYSTFERTSYEVRGDSPDYIGTTQWLWGIVAGVYLSLMGPQGMQDVGETILQRSSYAAARLGELDGVTSPALSGPFFKEFVVDFTGTGKTMTEINQGLRDRGIFGGHALAGDFPQMGQSALYCVTEVHDKADIDELVAALQEVLS
jgi:glycine dehydrogenase subunit 1